MIQKIVFWSVFSLALLLLVLSTRLNYPLGYGTNLFVYLLFLMICVFWMPENVRAFLLRYKRVLIGSCLASGCLFALAFFATAGGILLWYFDTFDFNDETVFLDEKYRVVIVSPVITSGGRNYFAVLRRKGWKESCVFRPNYYRYVDDSRVVEIDGQPALILPSEKDTIWFNNTGWTGK